MVNLCTQERDDRPLHPLPEGQGSSHPVSFLGTEAISPFGAGLTSLSERCSVLPVLPGTNMDAP